MHAKVENNKIIQFPILDIRQALPNVSLPEDLTKDALLPDGYVYVHIGNIPEYNDTTQKIELLHPSFKENKWIQEYTVINLNTAELARRRDEFVAKVKQDRNRRLSESDWTQAPDVSVDKQAWATYRQALRDVPSQSGYPFNVEWPTPPSN